jgi:hypothetical protein
MCNGHTSSLFYAKHIIVSNLLKITVWFENLNFMETLLFFSSFDPSIHPSFSYLNVSPLSVTQITVFFISVLGEDLISFVVYLSSVQGGASIQQFAQSHFLMITESKTGNWCYNPSTSQPYPLSMSTPIFTYHEVGRVKLQKSLPNMWSWLDVIRVLSG